MQAKQSKAKQSKAKLVGPFNNNNSPSTQPTNRPTDRPTDRPADQVLTYLVQYCTLLSRPHNTGTPGRGPALSSARPRASPPPRWPRHCLLRRPPTASAGVSFAQRSPPWRRRHGAAAAAAAAAAGAGAGAGTSRQGPRRGCCCCGAAG